MVKQFVSENKFLNNKKTIFKLSDEDLIDIAIECIIAEAKSYPCFGLVSAIDSGIHDDMNIETFLASSKTFNYYFQDIITLIKTEENLNLPSLRKLGKKQEQRMFAATNNINTHKGLIFCFGLIFYITLYLRKNKINFMNSEILLKTLTKSLEQDFNNFKEQTKGEICYKKYKIMGARGLALEGYKIVYNRGIPLIQFYKKKYSKLTDEDLCLILLIFYLSEIDDTNIIAKIGFQKNAHIKNSAKDLLKVLELKGWNSFYNSVMLINNFYKNLKISPGGCADLCVITLFLAKIV